MSDYQSCIILLSLPPQSLGGIDLISFQSTLQFQGFRNIPPGWHFVFTSATASLSIRYGVWFKVRKSGTNASPEVLVKKWNAEREDLAAETSEAVISKLKGSLSSIWQERLAPYRQTVSEDASTQEEKGDWSILVDSISEAMLSRITADHIQDHWTLSSASSAKEDEDVIPGLTGAESKDAFDHEKELHFLPIDLKQTWPSNATGRERTEAAQDRSWALNELIKNHCTNDDEMEILGELQFCFLMVLTLNNYSCLEQWKRILGILLTCKKAVIQRPRLFVRTLAVLKLQLQHCEDVEGGLFDFKDDEGNLLKTLLRRFKKGLEELQGKEKADVMDEVEEVESFLREQYGWELDRPFVRRGILELEDGEQVEMDFGADDEEFDERGEYAPMVVDLSEEQMRELTGEAGDMPASSSTRNMKVKGDSDSDEVDDEEDEEDEDLDMRY